MPVLSAKILTSGKSIISKTLLGVGDIFPAGFIVGDEAGFTPDENDTAVRGNVVYEGGANNIQVNQIAEDTIRYVCTISEVFGPFNVGNLIMYLDDGTNSPLPFISVALPVIVRKTQASPSFTLEEYAVPGARLAISIEIKHSQEAEILSVNIVTPDYSQIPTFGTEAEVPLGAALTFRQFIVNFDSRTKGPVLYTVDINNVRWGMPFTHQLTDPNFGHLDGGTDGEEYGAEPDDILSGYYYLTPAAAFSPYNLGESLYADTYGRILGNASYKPYVNS